MRWVVAQTLMIIAVAVSWNFSSSPHGLALRVLGWVLIAAGVALFATARAAMGSSFTIFPRPREGGRLVTNGPFRFVRNPIYLAGLLLLAGISLEQGWLGLPLTAALGVLWAAKIHVEESNLAKQFPEYAEYRQRVRYRLIPFVY